MRNFKRRREDLAKALKKCTSVTNNNHNISFSFGLERPDWELCTGCPHGLECNSGADHISVGHCRIDGERHGPHPYMGWDPIQYGELKDLPCCAPPDKGGAILFEYHGSICTSFDRAGRRFTDMMMWGHSITTTRAIRWYIDALAWNSIITPSEESTLLTWCNRGGRRTGVYQDAWVLL